MHKNSRTSIRTKIESIISEMTWSPGLGIQFGTDADNKILGLLRELQKDKNLCFLHQFDLYTIIYSKLFATTKHISTDTPFNTIQKILSPSALDELISKILDFLCQIPRAYNIRFDVPVFHGDKKFQIDNTVIYLSFKEKKEIEYLNSLMNTSDKSNNKTPTTSGLSCDTKGYCSNTRNDTFKHALSMLKIVIQQGLAKKLFIKNDKYINKTFDGFLAQALSQNKGKNIPLFYAYITDKLDGTSIKCELPDHVNSFLDKLKINYDQDLIRENLETDINIFLQRCNSIANTKDQRSKSIRSAIEWAFDSYTYEELDNSMAFLQICFGLEALFTENGVDIKEEKASILSTLSIKCAYLISTTSEDRELLVKKIKEIYRLRSNLVHGRQNSLTLGQIELLWYGRKILELSIEKEIQMNINNLN